MAEIGSNNLDDSREGKPIVGPADTHGDLDDAYEGKPIVGFDLGASAPSKASTPDPEDNEVDVAIDKQLSWADGGGATSYNVYFGTTSGALDSIGNQAGTSYDPGELGYETEYFWRIDAVNDEGTTTGDEWSFTTIAEAPPAGTRKATAVTIIT